MNPSPDDLTSHLQQLENDLLDPAVRRKREILASYLADGFRELGSSGRIYTRADILGELPAEPERQLTLTPFRCDLLAPGVALVTYQATRITPDAPPFYSLRSSLWVFRDARWQIFFHQGTPAHGNR